MYLSDDEKRSIIEQRLKQFAAEKFQHEINAEVSAAIGDEASKENADKAIETLTTAISVHEAKLAELPAVTE